MKQPKDEHYCSECIESMTIKCAWCQETIILGDPITLYTPRDKNFQVPEGAVIHSTDPLQLVGCLRWECAETGADRSGFWYPPGKVYRVMSAIEELTSRIKAGEECPIVVSNNVSDVSKAIPIEES